MKPRTINWLIYTFTLTLCSFIISCDSDEDMYDSLNADYSITYNIIGESVNDSIIKRHKMILSWKRPDRLDYKGVTKIKAINNFDAFVAKIYYQLYFGGISEIKGNPLFVTFNLNARIKERGPIKENKKTIRRATIIVTKDACTTQFTNYD